MLKDNLRKARIAAGLSKAAVARKLNMNYTTYDGYESGRRTPKPDSLPKIAIALGVDVNYLTDGRVVADVMKITKDENFMPNDDFISKMMEYKNISGMSTVISYAYGKLNKLGKVLLWKDAKKYLGIPELLINADELSAIEETLSEGEKALLVEQTNSISKDIPRAASILPILYRFGYSDEEIHEFVEFLYKQDPDAFIAASDTLSKTRTKK